MNILADGIYLRSKRVKCLPVKYTIKLSASAFVTEQRLSHLWPEVIQGYTHQGEITGQSI